MGPGGGSSRLDEGTWKDGLASNEVRKRKAGARE